VTSSLPIEWMNRTVRPVRPRRIVGGANTMPGRAHGRTSHLLANFGGEFLLSWPSATTSL
jgi:hypothetical protein